MNKNIITATCPTCRILLQVKTRSLEKTVVCPKCQTEVTVSAKTTVACGDTLPEAAFWHDQPRSLPAANPASLPVADPWPPSPNTSRRAMAIAVGVAAAVGLLAVGMVFAIRAGVPGRASAMSQPGNPQVPPIPGPGEGTGPGEITPLEGGASVQGNVQPDFGQQDVPATPPMQPAQQSGAAHQAAKAKVDRAASRIQSLERQKRDWLLANARGQFAAGKKMLIWPNERLLTQARQEYEMALREYEQSQ